MGDSALRIDGLLTTPPMPQAPITTNHSAITGPNSRPTALVPSRSSRNRPMRMTAVTGSTMAVTDGAATWTPSIEESTEMAGVIMLSPKNSAAPNTPSTASIIATRRLLGAPPADQRDQRHDPALAVVVGAHHQQHVGDHDDQHHGPEDQRDDAVDVLGAHLDVVRVGGVEDRLDGVQRARADVAEHDSQRTEFQCSPRGPAVHVPPRSPFTAWPNLAAAISAATLAPRGKAGLGLLG